MIHQTLKSAETTADIVIFVGFYTACSYYDLLLNSKNYILRLGDVMFTRLPIRYKIDRN